MGRELYEIVPGIELRPGDMIRTRPTDDPDGEVGEQVADVYRLRPDLKVFRRVDPNDDPRVLRRALELLFDQLYDGFCRANAMDRSINLAIDQARRELESEGRDGA